MQLHPKSNIREFSGKLFAESDPTKFRFVANSNILYALYPVDPNRKDPVKLFGWLTGLGGRVQFDGGGVHGPN